MKGRRLLSMLLDVIIAIMLWVLITAYEINIFLLLPLFLSLYFLTFEPLFLTSPGKWLVNFKIIKTHDSKTNIRILILGRNIAKIFTIITVFGILFNIISILSENGESWYDKNLGLSVTDSKTNELTDVQKNWRKHFKNK